MRVTIKLLTTTFLILLAMQLNAQKSGKLFRFVQLTDTQMGMISNNLNCEAENNLFSQAVNEINKLKPDFVVITGDFVNNRTDSNQLKSFQKIKSLIHKRIPVYLIPGNHDVGQKPNNETLNFYLKHYKTDRFFFTHKGFKFIGINSSLINLGTEQENAQLEWLKKHLKGKKPVILFTHHPFFITDINEKDKYENIPFAKRMEYMQLFKNHGVIKIFAGHYHKNAIAQYDGIEMITTSAVGKPLGKAKSGYRVVTVYKDSVSHKYIENSSF
jgi:3',5'-cyclic AMP phosphodiesterase CpdA